jgi:hypothetical protein
LKEKKKGWSLSIQQKEQFSDILHVLL